MRERGITDGADGMSGVFNHDDIEICAYLVERPIHTRRGGAVGIMHHWASLV